MSHSETVSQTQPANLKTVSEAFQKFQNCISQVEHSETVLSEVKFLKLSVLKRKRTDKRLLFTPGINMQISQSDEL